MYADLILALKRHGMKAELHQPDQLVLRDATGFGSPGWLTWHEGWFACTWGPTCYRLPPDTDLVAFCAAWREAPQGESSELAGELVDRYGLERVEYETLHWLRSADEDEPQTGDLDEYSIELPNKVAKALIDAPETTVANDLADEFGAPYELSDGRLVYWDPDATKVVVYHSRRHFAELERRMSSSATEQHILTGLLPQGDQFIRLAPDLIRLLPQATGIAASLLDGSIESLDHLDRLAQGKRVTQCLSPRLFPNLVAYIGEVMRRSTGGQWEFRQQKPSDILEPWIRVARGWYCPFSLLFDQLREEADETRSIRGAVEGHLRCGPHG